MSELIIIDNDYDRMEQFGREHRGGTPGAPKTPWGYLVEGKTIGKAVNNLYNATTSATAGQSGTIDILDVRGNDEYALPLCLTLSPPQIFTGLSGALPADLQSMSGSQDSIQLHTTFPPGNVGGKVTGPNSEMPCFSNPLAIVEWGIGGVTNRVEADFFNGLCLNLSASWVRVRSFIDSVLPPTSPTTPDTRVYRLSAFIGPGQAKPINAQRTVMLTQATAIDVESANTYTVPRYAKAVHLYGANAAHDTFVGTIRFYRNADLPASGVLTPVADFIFSGSNPSPVPIPAGAYYFTFVPGIANITSMGAVFQLSI